MRILLLIPAILFSLLLIINLHIFGVRSEINFFWFTRFNIPVAIFISLFFVLYITLLWGGFRFSHVFSDIKSRKQEKEIFELKNKLLSGQKDLITQIEARFQKILESTQQENEKKLELYKKENEKIVSNLIFEMEKLGNKIEKFQK